MPLITVSYSSIRKAPSLKAEIASAVSDLTARILRKDPRVTAIIVKSVDAADWFAGGKSLAEQSLASFWLDVHVSEGFRGVWFKDPDGNILSVGDMSV